MEEKEDEKDKLEVYLFILRKTNSKTNLVTPRSSLVNLLELVFGQGEFNAFKIGFLKTLKSSLKLLFTK